MAGNSLDLNYGGIQFESLLAILTKNFCGFLELLQLNTKAALSNSPW